MARPNFFCNIEALNSLLKMEFEGEYKDLELTFDLIELPYYFMFTSNEEEWTVKAFSRGEIYSHDGSGVEAGKVVVNKASGQGEVNASRGLAENMGAFFQASRNLSSYIQKHNLESVYADLDPEESGIMLSVENEELAYTVVSGADRPEMMCTTLFGGTVMCRPYMEDFWERSMRDEMSLEEKIEEAEDGDLGFMEELGMLYLNGDDEVEADPVKAVYWFQKLAEAGEPNGMFNLGLHYAKGHGVERDFQKAIHWMEKAAENGDSDAPALVEKYKKAAAAMLKIPSGDAQAQADLAGVLMALAGSLDQAGPGKDYEEAFELAQKSAAQGNGDGIWTLALAYEHGRGVRKSVAKAIECYRKGTELGHAACQHSLGCYYMRGDRIQKDMVQAFELILKAAEQGYGLAMKDVGRCYQFGNGVEESMPKAIEWYEKALEVIDDPELAQKVAVFKNLESSGAFCQDPQGDLPDGYMDALQAFIDEEEAREGTNLANLVYHLGAEFDPEKETATLTEEVVGTQFEGRNQRIEHIRVGDILNLVREPENKENGLNISVRNKNGESLGNLSIGTCRMLAPIMDENLAKRIVAKVCEVIPLSKRGPRAKKSILKLTITLEFENTVSCVVCNLAGDQVNTWVQQLTVSYSTMSARHAKMLFELYNRHCGEYDNWDNGENDTSYAGLDNLEEEIRAAREKMQKERNAGLDYSKDEIETYESFGAYMQRMIAKDASRYGALRRYEIEEYDRLQDILSRYTIAKKTYYWVDQTRSTEEEFNETNGYNHWYEVLELYEGKQLPVDLSDEDVVSIFGCGKFAAFADLSYGC